LPAGKQNPGGAPKGPLGQVFVPIPLPAVEYQFPLKKISFLLLGLSREPWASAMATKLKTSMVVTTISFSMLRPRHILLF
jgi:hypothetical protein